MLLNLNLFLELLMALAFVYSIKVFINVMLLNQSLFADGYASCDDVLSNKEFQEAVGNKTMQDILQLVDGENKKRFELTQVNHEWMIRATYGHSIKVRIIWTAVLWYKISK